MLKYKKNLYNCFFSYKKQINVNYIRLIYHEFIL